MRKHDEVIIGLHEALETAKALPSGVPIVGETTIPILGTLGSKLSSLAAGQAKGGGKETGDNMAEAAAIAATVELVTGDNKHEQAVTAADLCYPGSGEYATRLAEKMLDMSSGDIGLCAATVAMGLGAREDNVSHAIEVMEASREDINRLRKENGKEKLRQTDTESQERARALAIGGVLVEQSDCAFEGVPTRISSMDKGQLLKVAKEAVDCAATFMIPIKYGVSKIDTEKAVPGLDPAAAKNVKHAVGLVRSCASELLSSPYLDPLSRKVVEKYVEAERSTHLDESEKESSGRKDTGGGMIPFLGLSSGEKESSGRKDTGGGMIPFLGLSSGTAEEVSSEPSSRTVKKSSRGGDARAEEAPFSGRSKSPSQWKQQRAKNRGQDRSTGYLPWRVTHKLDTRAIDESTNKHEFINKSVEEELVKMGHLSDKDYEVIRERNFQVSATNIWQDSAASIAILVALVLVSAFIGAPIMDTLGHWDPNTASGPSSLGGEVLDGTLKYTLMTLFPLVAGAGIIGSGAKIYKNTKKLYEDTENATERDQDKKEIMEKFLTYFDEEFDRKQGLKNSLATRSLGDLVTTLDMGNTLRDHLLGIDSYDLHKFVNSNTKLLPSLENYIEKLRMNFGEVSPLDKHSFNVLDDCLHLLENNKVRNAAINMNQVDKFIDQGRCVVYVNTEGASAEFRSYNAFIVNGEVYIHKDPSNPDTYQKVNYNIDRKGNIKCVIDTNSTIEEGLLNSNATQFSKDGLHAVLEKKMQNSNFYASLADDDKKIVKDYQSAHNALNALTDLPNELRKLNRHFMNELRMDKEALRSVVAKTVNNIGNVASPRFSDKKNAVEMAKNALDVIK